MAIELTCPNGHKLKVKDEFAGRAGLCPCCKARVDVPKKVDHLDDAILSVLGPQGAESAPKPQAPDVISELFSATKRKKVCPSCGGETSYAFTICPRCGTPLPNTPGPRAK
jgi:predicted amidophosphoribosyltransferase